MAVPTYLTEGGGDKVLGVTDAAEAFKYLAAIEIASAPSGYGWLGVATHVEDDAVASPGGFTTSKAPIVLMGGDLGGNVKPLQLDASEFLKVILQTGSAAIGKLSANSGVDIGDVDVTSLPVGQGAMAASTPVVLASDQTDIKITLDGEAVVLGAGSAAIGKLVANSGVDIGDVDVTSLVPGVAATSLGKAEDAIHGTGDVGVMALAVRDDAGAATAADGDYHPLLVNSAGALYVTGGGGGTEYIVDAAAPATPTGSAMLAERDDALGGLTPAEGDWTQLFTDANGALWTHDNALDAVINGSELQVDIVAALPAGTNEIGKLAAGSAAIGKLAANSGVDIGDVDVTSLPTGQGVMAGSTPVVLASDHSDTKITLDGETVVLGAGAAAIGKLAANSGIDIGDVDVITMPATAAEGGALPAVFMVVAGDDGTDTHPLQLAGDGDLKVTLDGESVTAQVTDNGPAYTVITEQLDKSTTADATLHTTTGGTRFYITDIIISVSGTAIDVRLAFGVGTGMTTQVLKFYGDVRGGLTHHFRSPLNAGSVADNLNIDLSAAQAMSITICGYEV